VQREVVADAWEYGVEGMLGPWDLQQDRTVSRGHQLTLEFPGEARLDDMILRALYQ
jgi:hypothetical protein